MVEPTPAPGSPWRTSRWWLTTALALVGVLACLALGAWQFDRARTRDTPTGPTDPMAAAPVELADALPADSRVLPGRDPVGVTVTGRYDGQHQLQVPGRVVGGEPVAYVVTPLVTADGRGILVVRGTVPDPAGAAPPPSPPPPSGEVTVVGWLTASEPLEAGTVDPLELGPDQVATVTAARVLSLVPYPLVDGYVGLVSQTGQGAVIPSDLAPLPVPLIKPGIHWSVQSLSYALEWWFFALAGVWMWVQALRIERRRLAEEADASLGEPEGQPADAAPPAG